MKKFFAEFKKFISRGNVLDMSVGVIVGGAFTAIVNGLSNFILKPVINWLLALMLGKGSLENILTFLGEPAYKLDANGASVIDLANSFYIDWGSFINAIINFLLIALVLFIIVRTINKINENNSNLLAKVKKGMLTKEERKALKAQGKKLTAENIRAYLEEKDRLAKEQEEKAKLEAEEKARQDRLENPTTEDLLKDIKELLKGMNK